MGVREHLRDAGSGEVLEGEMVMQAVARFECGFVCNFFGEISKKVDIAV